MINLYYFIEEVRGVSVLFKYINEQIICYDRKMKDNIFIIFGVGNVYIFFKIF